MKLSISVISGLGSNNVTVVALKMTLQPEGVMNVIALLLTLTTNLKLLLI
jgi:hypothetical protein